MGIQWDWDRVWELVDWEFAPVRTPASVLAKLTRDFGQRSGRCFHIANLLAWKCRKDLWYCEGFAGRHSVTPHAWVALRDKDDFAYEVTWPFRYRNITLEKGTYAGLRIEPLVGLYMTGRQFDAAKREGREPQVGGYSVFTDPDFLATGILPSLDEAEEWRARKFSEIRSAA